MTMRDFANQVIVLANRKVGGITNLELQKVMYFAMGSYISENGIDSFIENIYNEPFEAWPYGPVVRSIYFEHKARGRFRINCNPDYNHLLSPIDSYIIRFLGRPVKELVEESHEHELWRRNRDAIMLHHTIQYTLEDIRNAFIS